MSREVIELLVTKLNAAAMLFVQAVAKILLELRALRCCKCCIDLLKCLVNECGLDIWGCQDELHQISEVHLCYYFCSTDLKKVDRQRLRKVVAQRLEFVSGLGCNIQCNQHPAPCANGEQKAFASNFDSLQSAQRKQPVV